MPYAPPGNQVGTGSLNHQATVYYDRRGLDKLKPELHFAQVADARPLPKNSGRTLQAYRFDVAAAGGATPAVDGVIGMPIPLGSQTVSVKVEEYNDFTSSSQLLEDTDIAPFVDEMVDYTSTRAARLVDVLGRTEIDSISSAQTVTLGAYFTAADVRANVTKLKALDVHPYEDGSWRGIIHPYAEFDLVSDNTAGGFIDCSKYQNGQALLNAEIGKVGGVRFFTTTQVGTSGSAPNVLYNTYIFGRGSLIHVDLSGSGPSMIVDPLNQRFQTFVTKGGPSAVDPAGTIGTYVAYRFVDAFKVPYTSNDQYRFKSVQCDASLV